MNNSSWMPYFNILAYSAGLIIGLLIYYAVMAMTDWYTSKKDHH